MHCQGGGRAAALLLLLLQQQQQSSRAAALALALGQSGITQYLGLLILSVLLTDKKAKK